MLVFQLGTHRELMADDEAPPQQEPQSAVVVDSELGSCAQPAAQPKDDGEDDDDDDDPVITARYAIVLMLAATLVVTICSEFLTDTLETALADAGLGKEFVGIILLPIVGNACEHASAIQAAINNKCGTSVGIAIGSSTQIALFVTPFTVLVGWFLGSDPTSKKFELNMDLDFGALNVAVLTMSVLVVLAITLDGKSNWLEGYLLCTAYVMIAVLYWYVPTQIQTP